LGITPPLPELFTRIAINNFETCRGSYSFFGGEVCGINITSLISIGRDKSEVILKLVPKKNSSK
jgi:hypothetical protein